MKKILLSSMIAAAAAVPAIAGVNNINYQAVITDANGVMADKKVEMKFELLDKSDNVVYTEEQTPTTSANGMVVCQLGKDDELSTIEWGDLTLRVSMKVGNSYEVISNEAVSSVPTALYALKSADSDMLIEEVTRINTEADEMRSNLNSLGADVAQIEGLSEQVEEITSAVEELVQETELNKETIIGINAEIVKLNGLSDDLENLQENLTNSFTAVDAQIEEINGQLENLNNVAGVTRANEEAIEEMNTNLDSSFTMVETRFDKIQTQVDAQDKDIEDLKGQVENLNNVSAVTRANEQAIEELNTNLDSSFTMVETRFDKIQNQVDAQDKDIEDLKGQVENLNNVAAVTRANEEAIEELNTNLDSSFTMVETRFDKIQTQ
ncbi:MAG: hypothetical protein K2G23_03115, partial [Muribaculaceae bacterium]|nr:hypothetical protein [Muribaculaceae bacterium]